jgi:hypothetical protein
MYVCIYVYMYVYKHTYKCLHIHEYVYIHHTCEPGAPTMRRAISATDTCNIYGHTWDMYVDIYGHIYMDICGTNLRARRAQHERSDFSYRPSVNFYVVHLMCVCVCVCVYVCM